MLSGQPFQNVMVINIFIAALWHFISFYLCVFINTSFFDADKKMYRPKKWERGGKFYSDTMKINSWKDLLPQHIGKNGFSKDHLNELSIEYIDEFIMETCRGEWNHTLNCTISILLMIINDLFTGIIFSAMIFIGNIPFAIIQRYNRFRLQRLKRTLLRKAEIKKRK